MGTIDTNSKRLLSLDALRGFDMLFIMGFSGLIVNLGKVFPDCQLLEWLSIQMRHVPWDGFAHHDTIFPLFLFIAGVSFPFSYSRQKESGVKDRQIIYKVIKRAIILIILGILYNGFFKLQFESLRFPSVLGRIGLAWMFAALIYMAFKPKTRAIIAAIILIGYSLLLTIPAPDIVGATSWSVEGNIVGYIDRSIMPNHILKRGVMDPEGLLSTLPAIVTALLGIFTGEFVRRNDISAERKTVIMFISAILLLVAGIVWNIFQPINKALWSSAFVLTAAAYSVAMFSLFYYIIDVKHCQRWALFFRVIGVNSITIYLAQRFIPFGDISRYFFGGLATKLPEGWGAVVISIGYIAACWLLLYFLDRKKVYLKV